MKTIYDETTEVNVAAGRSGSQIEAQLQDVILRDLIHNDGFQRAINQAGLGDERGVVQEAGVYTVHIKVTRKGDQPAPAVEPEAVEAPVEPEKPAPKVSSKK